MNLSTALYVLNISIIQALIFYLVYLVSDRKHGLLMSIIMLIFGFGKCMKWYWDNPIYLVRSIYATVLLLINITLIGQLMNSALFNRTLWLLVLSPLVWFVSALYTWMREREIKRLEQENQ